MAEEQREPIESDAQLVERITASILDRFLDLLTAEMAQSEAAPTIDEVWKLARKFKEKEAGRSLEMFRGQLDDYLRYLEKEIWDQTRRRPFDRFLVKRFSHLFPPKGGLDIGKGVLSRRILPGFFQAIEQLAGPKLFAQCQDACKEIVREKKKSQGSRLRWEELYDDEEANRLIDDLLVAVASHFVGFQKRCEWLYILIDGHLAPAEDYDFEGDAVYHWTPGDRDILELLRALFSRFRGQLADDDGRRRFDQRYGEKARHTLQAILANIDLALAKSGS